MQEPSLPHSVFANRLSQTKLFTEPQKNKLTSLPDLPWSDSGPVAV